MRYYVEINGESSLDIQGLMIQSLPSISKPLMRSKQETIDGRDGDIVTKLGYSAYDKTLKIGLWGNYDINEVIAFFNQEGTITFSNEPDKYYRFTILNRDDYVSQLDKFRTCTIALHCQPYKYKLNEEPEEIENEYEEQEGTSLTFNNTLVAPMNIDLKGNTSQTGTPTPSSPIPINNVSGDNDIVVCGKNLFDGLTESGAYNNSTGVKVVDSNSARNKNPLYVKANTDYCFSDNGNAFNLNIIFYKKDGTYINHILGNTTFTTPNETAYINFYRGTDLSNRKVIITYGTTLPTYEAYNGTTYNIDLPVENLLDADTIIPNMIQSSSASIRDNWSYNSSNKVLTLTTYNTDSYMPPIYNNAPYINGININVEKNTDYILSFDIDQPLSIMFNCVMGLDKTSNTYKYITTLGSTTTMSFNTANYDTITFRIGTNNTASVGTITHFSNFMLQKGTKKNSHTPYGTTPIELNKIGTYQDYFYKENNKWYLHKEIGKVVLDGTTNSFTNRYTTNTNNYYRHVWENGSVKNQQSGTIANAYCNKLSPVSIGSTYGCVQGVSINDINHRIIMYITDIREMTIEQANQWLKTNNIIVYYLLDTPTNTEITYTPLIEQLNTLENAMSKEGTTNINQVNNDAPFIITASVLSGTDSITLTNEGNTTSKPTLTITGSGVVGVYLENIQMFNISLGTNETIIIDTENMEAYYGSQLKNRQVTGDYSNFALQSGTNNLKFTGLVTNVEITNYNRWI